MTNSEALKELLVAVGGTEPEEAKTNLELLNAISEQLGGDADAENNAVAIHNIAQNASGGGGGKMREIEIANSSASVGPFFVGSLESVGGRTEMVSQGIEVGTSEMIKVPFPSSQQPLDGLPLIIECSPAFMTTSDFLWSVSGTNCTATIIYNRLVGTTLLVIVSILQTEEQEQTGEPSVTITLRVGGGGNT